MPIRSRRSFLRSAAFGAGALALAACGQAAPAAEPTTAPAAEPAPVAPTAMPAEAMGSTVEITYWGSFSGALGEAEQATVDAFNNRQSDVRVNYQFQGSYEDTAQKLTAAIQARQTPDVSLLSDVWWFSFYINNYLQPLDDLMASESIKREDYSDVLLREGVRKNSVYWVPFARSTPIFYYNKDAWAEAGLPDRGPETWGEFAEWAPKLNSDTRSAFAHPGAASYVAWLFQGVIWQHSGSYSDADFTIRIQEENGVRAGNFYRDTTQTFKWATAPQDVTQDFTTGLTASAMLSTAALAGVENNAEFNVGTAFLPQADGFGCPTGGAGMAILAGLPAEKQQAAMKWIAFATGDEWTVEWSQRTGYMPVRTAAVQSAKMQAFFNERPNFRTVVEQLPLTQPQDAARVYIRGGDQIIGKGLERILIGGEDVPAVWAEVKAELEETAAPTLELLRQVE
ncbi:MAG TPA: ABC transporter substrate-binding protein [Roseiflexaceae bacterium]|nr:ABC transporter substrate-binding protein [Roseiflexaceae bacterium]HMP42049.1 ABC transporter substrate-binding protein [Roseiflexaceae bacterium]